MSDTKQITLNTVVQQLCEPSSYIPVWHQAQQEDLMPSVEHIEGMMALVRSVLFPGYFGRSGLTKDNMFYYLGARLDKFRQLLTEQIKASLCFGCHSEVANNHCDFCGNKAAEYAEEFLLKLPQIRHLLSSDVKAAFEGDPAANSFGETIFCYPSIVAMTHHRVAHELYEMGIPMLPRIISELAHSATGIDIHPGATIGEEFFIDHGTGTVIGETCRIGKGCRLYQGVTLGAVSFPKEDDGTLVKGIARHPILEDNVTIYANATVLGRITIGAGSVIGGNVWLTHGVEPGTRLLNTK